MRTNRIRTTVAGLAAGLALSIAGTGVAAAAVVVHQPGPTVTSTNVVYTGPTVAEQVKGGATGTGPADQAECDRYAVAIDSWIQGGVDDYHGGNVSAAVSDFNYANALESDGMDAGCFFQY